MPLPRWGKPNGPQGTGARRRKKAARSDGGIAALDWKLVSNGCQSDGPNTALRSMTNGADPPDQFSNRSRSEDRCNFHKTDLVIVCPGGVAESQAAIGDLHLGGPLDPAFTGQGSSIDRQEPFDVDLVDTFIVVCVSRHCAHLIIAIRDGDLPGEGPS